MSVLIKGMNKDQFDEILRLARIGANNCMIGEHLEIVEVPTPHGRLIDGDELKTAFPRMDNSTDIKIHSVRATINHMPTVIEAEE